MILAFSFFNPFLLWGAGLASVPLIIHILNKRRFKKIRWAAIEFLLKAEKETRRRMRFEQLLLLLLRMGLVALLAFLLARPMASSEDLLGLGRRSVHHVIVLDDSGSLGERSGVGTVFDSARKKVLEISDQIGKTRGGDYLTLWRSSSSKPDLSARPVTTTLRSDLSEVLSSSRATPDRFEPTALFEGLRRIDQALGEKASRLSIYLVSDYRRIDFMGTDGRLKQNLIKGLRGLRGGTGKLFFFPVTKTGQANLGIVQIKPLQARSIQKIPSRFEVEVFNFSKDSSTKIPLGFQVDGGARITREMDSIPPNSSKVLVFNVDFASAGSHVVQADLPMDRLALDNRRALAVEVQDAAQILLVDGDPGERLELSETFYLASALDPSEDGASGFSVTRSDEYNFSQKKLKFFDLVVLANMSRLPEKEVKRLADWVKAGGGLLIFSGDQVSVNSYNSLLWKNGKGLLPAPLGQVEGDMGKPLSPVIATTEHPLFQGMTEVLSKLLSLVSIGRYHEIERDAQGKTVMGEGTKVLLRLGDENGPPLLLEKQVGKGSVALITTTADASWTSWPGDFSYPVLLTRLSEQLLRPMDLSPFNLGPRGVWPLLLPAADYRPALRIQPLFSEGIGPEFERGVLARPDKENPDLLKALVGPEEGRPWPVAGAWGLRVDRVGLGVEKRFFSVSPWREEGRLETVPKKTFLAGLPSEMAQRALWVDGASAAKAGFLVEEGEFWRVLAFALLGFLLLESFLAWRFGHH
jgi:hypothetical protein